MAFILPATSAFGSNSVEEVDASDEQTVMKNIGETPQTTIMATESDLKFISDTPLPGPGQGCHPVKITDIVLTNPTAAGTYPIEIELSLPNCNTGTTPIVEGILDAGLYTHITTDSDTEQDCTLSCVSDEFFEYATPAGPWTGGSPFSLTTFYGDTFDFDVTCDEDTTEYEATVEAPFILAAGDQLDIWRDYTMDGVVDQCFRYDFTTAGTAYYTYASPIWTLQAWPGSVTWTFTGGDTFSIKFTSSFSTCRWAARAKDVNKWPGHGMHNDSHLQQESISR